MMIASNLVDGRSISTSWKDIAGLEDVVQELVETVILPIQKRDLFSASQLTQAPKGVLLHGPPGTRPLLLLNGVREDTFEMYISKIQIQIHEVLQLLYLSDT